MGSLADVHDLTACLSRSGGARPLDPYHFKVAPEIEANEIEGPEIGEFHGPWVPLTELLARGGEVPLREH